MLFSDAFSGRAEFGLIGSDDFKLKVSYDGTAFVEAFNIDKTSGNLTLPRGLSLSGVISPAQITSNQNDYTPAGIASASVLQLSSDASRTISGLAGGGEGRIVSVLNIGSQNIILADESASSTAANRFTLGGDLALMSKQGIILRYDGTASRWFAIARSGGGVGGREVLAANRTYYVRTDGNDSNTGLSNTSGGALLTLQKAINVVAALDISIFNVTIQVGAGTYTAGLIVNGPWVGTGRVTVAGDTTTPSNVFISTNAASAVNVKNNGTLSVQGVKVAATNTFAAIYAQSGATITLSGKNEYGSVAVGHDIVAEHATVVASSPEILSGTTAGSHYYTRSGGFIDCTSAVWSTSGTAVRSAFAQADSASNILAFSNSYTGTYVMQRYNVNLNAVIIVNGQGPNAFPGNAAGTDNAGSGKYSP